MQVISDTQLNPTDYEHYSYKQTFKNLMVHFEY